MSFVSWRQRRRAVREGALLEREAKRGLKRFGSALSPEARGQVEGAVRSFDAAKDGGTVDALVESVNTLDRALDQHLAFARKSTTREYIEAIGTAVLIALFLRAFVVEAFKIPSGSMIPTLQVGDHIFVNKFIYGVRVPFTNIKLGQSMRRPKRGEVIVFIYPVNHDQDFIKRIIAVENDVVEMRDGLLYVNNEHVANAPIAGDCIYDDVSGEGDDWSKYHCVAMSEHIGATGYTTYYEHPPGQHELNPEIPNRAHDMPPFRIPPGHVFCMGDNRDHSSDSRIWGVVPEDLIKGKAMIIWWSQGDPNQKRDIPALDWMRNVPIVQWVYGARFDRMFDLVK